MYVAVFILLSCDRSMSDRRESPDEDAKKNARVNIQQAIGSLRIASPTLPSRPKDLGEVSLKQPQPSQQDSKALTTSPLPKPRSPRHSPPNM